LAYALQDQDQHDDVAGPGNGFIDVFDTGGHFLKRFASGTAVGGALTTLNSPWGMAVSPCNFGKFSNDVLVGNFGDSHVSAFGPLTGKFLGQLSDANGTPLVLTGGFVDTDTKGLWGITFGNGAGGAAKSILCFTSGINDEGDGLFGKLTVANKTPTGSIGQSAASRTTSSSQTSSSPVLPTIDSSSPLTAANRHRMFDQLFGNFNPILLV
jgi:uncharacterized protein (TIGR03118 family)